MLRNLLFYRWLLFNGVVLAGIASVWPQGFLQELYTTDTTGITWGITALFVLAWLWTLKEVAVLCHDLNENARLGGSEPAWAFERDKDIAKVQWLAFISVGLVTLGLMGTFIGLKMAVAIDGGTLSSAAGAKQWGAQIMAGFNVAINTTLLGSGLALWNDVNQRILRTALSSFWADRLAADKGVNVRHQD